MANHPGNYNKRTKYLSVLQLQKRLYGWIFCGKRHLQRQEAGEEYGQAEMNFVNREMRMLIAPRSYNQKFLKIKRLLWK